MAEHPDRRRTEKQNKTKKQDGVGRRLETHRYTVQTDKAPAIDSPIATKKVFNQAMIKQKKKQKGS